MPEPRGGSRSSIRRNRRSWDRASAAYDRRHAAALGGRKAMAWGLWRVPEREVNLLGKVRGQTILEVGCGAGRWSIGLVRQGAHPVGLDLSAAQLRRANELQRAAGVRFPLVRASAERIPLADGSFDLVFSDWGAMSFADPHRSLPECSRVLRNDGRLVFVTGSPIGAVATHPRTGRYVRSLSRPYFGLYRLEFGPKEPIEYRLTYADWIRLFRRNGFEVERLEETRPNPSARSSYLDRGAQRFARSWPLESIWCVRKRGRAPAHRTRKALKITAMSISS